MNKEIDNNMYKIIIEWGIPNVVGLKDRNIDFLFDSSKVSSIDKYYQDLKCEYNDVKFCLYDFDNEKIIFSMDFCESNKTILSLTGEKPHIRLELLNVNDYKLRNKGIASYYLSKLQDYAMKNNMEFIKVKPCANDKIFNNESDENSLDQNELIEFYRRKSTKEMPIKIFECKK